ncbi:transposable element Tcb2 transposase [Trichonephila clavipes]|nr:transposable element Tcb2 transposase [Trichonephila clavipes]
MDDNARPHRTLAVEELLESEDITRMDRPAYSPDLNLIEHVWDALGRRFAARLHHPENTQQLKQMLIEEWALLPSILGRHVFTSINGLKFEWQLEQQLQDETIDGIVARLIPLSTFNECSKIDGWALRGLLGHSVIVEAFNLGIFKVKASLKQSETEISTEVKLLRVTSNFRILPAPSLRILRYGTVPLGVEHIRGRKLSNVSHAYGND